MDYVWSTVVIDNVKSSPFFVYPHVDLRPKSDAHRRPHTGHSKRFEVMVLAFIAALFTCSQLCLS